MARRSVAGCYVNYPDVDLDELGPNFGLEMYYLDNFTSNPRNLVSVKKRWDPQDFFHHQQSIPVAVPPEGGK